MWRKMSTLHFNTSSNKAFHFQPLPRCVDQFSNILKQSGDLQFYTTSSILIPSTQKSAAIIIMGFGSSCFVVTWTEITRQWEVGEISLHLLGLNSNKSVSIAKWGRPELSNKNEIHCLRLKIWPDLNAVKITFVSAIKSPSHYFTAIRLPIKLTWLLSTGKFGFQNSQSCPLFLQYFTLVHLYTQIFSI